MPSLEALFCHVDDFCRWFEPRWQQRLLDEGLQRRCRCRSLSLSEIMPSLDCLPSIGVSQLQVVQLPSSSIAIGAKPFLD